MALVLADRVRDTTTTTGTGTVTLSGTAPTGYQTFGAAIGNGNTTYYTINAGSQWEVGLGTYSSTGPTLARTTVLSSSNGGSLVDFSTGTKDVFVTYPAEKSINEDASGNVGVGVAPSAWSAIKAVQTGLAASFSGGAAFNDAFIASNAYYDGSNWRYINSNAAYYQSVGGSAAARWYTAASGTAGNAITFTQAMTLDASGNLGVGTSAPTYKLHVATTGVNALGVYRDLDVTSVGAAGQLIELGARNGSTFTPGATITGVLENPATTGYMSFATRSSSTLTERMRIDSSGNVGIGTSSPGGTYGKLTVAGGMRTVEDTSSKLEIGRYSSGAPNSYIKLSPNSASLRFTNAADDTDLMTLTNAGNVGIGTTSPAQKLSVNGNIVTAGEVALSGADFVYSWAGGTTGQRRAGFYLDGSNQVVRVYTAQNEVARFDASGNLGVGTSSPSSFGKLATLNSSGATALYAGTSAQGVFVRANDSTRIVQFMSSGSLTGGFSFSNGATDTVTIDVSGNVGIGTSAPAYRLDVRSGATATAGQFNSTATTAYNPAAYNGGAARLFLYGGNSTNSFTGTQYTHGGSFEAFFGAVQNSSGLADFVFQGYNGSAYAERMRIDSSGNVGIGTSSPATKLDVLGASSDQIRVRTAGTEFYRFGRNSSTGYMDFYGSQTGYTGYTFGGVDGERMRIDSSGNVGIGLTNPGSYGRLVVGDPSNTTNNIFQILTRYATFSITADATTAANGAAIDVSWANGGQGPLRFSLTGSEKMRIGSNGCLAIGATGTDATIHIGQALGGYNRFTQMNHSSGTSVNAFNIMAAKNSGGADAWWSWGVRSDSVWSLQEGVNSALNGSLGFYYDGAGQAFKSGGGSWASTSDARVKTNITPISNAASRIMALKPSSFDYRVPEAHRGRVSDRGFIAQDFEEVYPHSVSESAMVADAEKTFVTGDDKIKAISLNNDFFADLVALVQEQQTTINDLRARVAQLEGN